MLAMYEPSVGWRNLAYIVGVRMHGLGREDWDWKMRAIEAQSRRERSGCTSLISASCAVNVSISVRSPVFESRCHTLMRWSIEAVRIRVPLKFVWRTVTRSW